jgi:hypothetical protein
LVSFSPLFLCSSSPWLPRLLLGKWEVSRTNPVGMPL